MRRMLISATVLLALSGCMSYDHLMGQDYVGVAAAMSATPDRHVATPSGDVYTWDVRHEGTKALVGEVLAVSITVTFREGRAVRVEKRKRYE